jgi:tetratricopeptide (TPR) repeat protein
MRFKMLFAWLFFVVMFLVFFPGYAQSASLQGTLNRYVAALQKNPSDNTLREKIIKLALMLDQKPVAPQDAVMHENAAEYAIENAKTTADFAAAAREYEQALFAAPWIAADYFKCGVAYEKAGQFDAAIRNFNLYLMAAPGAQDANDVLKRIGELEYAGQKGASGSSPEAEVAQEQSEVVKHE